jgi:hypothetical protein
MQSYDMHHVAAAPATLPEKYFLMPSGTQPRGKRGVKKNFENRYYSCMHVDHIELATTSSLYSSGLSSTSALYSLVHLQLTLGIFLQAIKKSQYLVDTCLPRSHGRAKKLERWF